jgi:hypothetical protein
MKVSLRVPEADRGKASGERKGKKSEGMRKGGNEGKTHEEE